MPRGRAAFVVMVTGDVGFWLDMFARFHFDVVRFLGVVVREVNKFVHQTLAANLEAGIRKMSDCSWNFLRFFFFY